MNNLLVFNSSILIKNPLISKKTFNLRAFWILTIVLLIILLGFYIFQINELAKGIYYIRRYETKLFGISQEHRALEITFFQNNSLKNIDDLVEKLNFEKPVQITHIQPLDSPIVVK